MSGVCVCGSLIIHHKAVFMCVLVFNSDYSSRLLIRLIGQRWWPVIDAGRWPHHYGLWSQWEKMPQPSSLLHTHTTFKKTQTEESCVSSVTPWTDHPNKANRTSENFTSLSLTKTNYPPKIYPALCGHFFYFIQRKPPETPERVWKILDKHIQVSLLFSCNCTGCPASSHEGKSVV